MVTTERDEELEPWPADADPINAAICPFKVGQ
jgi:hypothetical protein